MRRLWLLVLVCSLGAGAPGATGVLAQGDGAVVASVSDGDTLTLTNGARVRLLQIDTPELGSGECYSRAARTALLALAPVGARVTLELDPALDRTDRYGRQLRYVLRGGTNVNLELVRLGAAAPYFYRGERGRYSAGLLRAAEQARAAKRGLWRACPSARLDPGRAVATGRSGPPAKVAPVAGRCDPNYAGGCVPRIRRISTARTSARSGSLRCAWSAPIRTASMATATASAASSPRVCPRTPGTPA